MNRTDFEARVRYKLRGWYSKDQFLIVDTCKAYIAEMESYSWKENKDLEPEDANDHLINSAQYAWIPYVHKIGGNT